MQTLLQLARANGQEDDYAARWAEVPGLLKQKMPEWYDAILRAEKEQRQREEQNKRTREAVYIIGGAAVALALARAHIPAADRRPCTAY